MSSDVTEHDHCRFCGDAVPLDQAYCSLECYYNDQERLKKEKRNETILAVVAVTGCIGILIAGFLF